MASIAVAGVGTVFVRWNGTAWEAIAEINSITGPSMGRETIDVTSLDTEEGYRQFITGFKNGGTVVLAMNFTRDTYELMKDDFEVDDPHDYGMVLPDEDETVLQFSALVTELPMTIPADDKITADVTLQITGEVRVLGGELSDGDDNGNGDNGDDNGEEIDWKKYWENKYPEFKTYSESLTTPLAEDEVHALGCFYDDIITGAGVTALSDIFDAAWMLQNASESASYTNLVKDAHHLNVIDDITWARYEGITGAGGYVDTNYNPHIHGVNYTLNDASIGFYSVADVSEASGVEMGVRIDAKNTIITVNRGGLTDARLNTDTSPVTRIPSDFTSIGLYIATRNSGDASGFVLHKDKDTPSNQYQGSNPVSTGVPNGNIYLLSLNNEGTNTGPSTKTLYFAFIAKHITPALRDVIADALVAYRARIALLQDNEYDVCVVGGGSAAIGVGYALRDSGLKVAIVEQESMLGGTHTAGMIYNFVPSPDPAFFKTQIYDYLAPQYKISLKAEENWYRTQMCYVRPKTDGQTFAHSYVAGSLWYDRITLANKYLTDFRNIDIFLKTKFVNASASDGVCESVIIEDKEGKQDIIKAKYFLDCSCGNLCRNINTVRGTDYFIGSDDKTKYNESCYPDGYIGSEIVINNIDLNYRIKPDPLDEEDTSVYPDVPGTGVATNGIYDDYHDRSCRIVSPDYGGNFDRTLLPTTNPKVLRNQYVDNVLSSWKIEKATTAGMDAFQFDKAADMLGIREGFRINCDNMITQDDVSVRVTSVTDLAATKIIALASWFFDFHGGEGATVDLLQRVFQTCFGIPIGSLFPVGLKNVSIACRSLGVSHIAASATRTVKTMMSVGYAAGFIAEDFVKNDREDQRDVPVSTIQTKVAISDSISYMENNCYGKNYDVTWEEE